MKKSLIIILVWFIVAGFFYAAIWTHEKNTLSDCFVYTGFVAIFQIILTCASFCMTQIKD